jgi:hypothetical protein
MELPLDLNLLASKGRVEFGLRVVKGPGASWNSVLDLYLATKGGNQECLS